VRDEIYELSLEPRVLFYQGYHEMNGPGGFDNTLNVEKMGSVVVEDTIGDYGLKLSHDTHVSDEEEDNYPVWYKIFAFTPLLLVNQEVALEARGMLQRTRPRLHAIIKSTIRGQRFIAPSPYFLEICARSRFILGGSSFAHGSIRFLKRLPRIMSRYVRDIAIMDLNLTTKWSRTSEAWPF
jgi:hypothetical protein